MSLSAAKPESETVTLPKFLLDDSPALQKKLAEFEAAEKRAADAVEVLGIVGDIYTYHDQAKRERDEADEIGTAARNEAQEVLQQAGERAVEIKREAQSAADETILGADSRLQSAQRIEDAAQVKMGEVRRTEEANNILKGELERRSVTLSGKFNELENQQQQLLQEKSKLASVREQINKILG